MGCPSFVFIGDNLVFSVCTHDPDTGILTDADSVPAYRVYEDETGTAILNGSMAKLDDANTTGFYTESIACTSGNGFENAKTYTIYIQATVDSDTGGICYGFKALTAGGASLNAIPWNAAWDAEVQSEVTDALVAHNLDHLCLTATASADMTTEVADNTILSRLLASGDTSAFDPTTDSLQDIRDAITSSVVSAATIADAVWDEVLSGHLTTGDTTAADYLEEILEDTATLATGVTVTPASGVSATNAQEPVEWIDFDTYSSGSVALLANVRDWDGDYLTPAGVASIYYTIYKCVLDSSTNTYTRTAVTGHSNVSATVSDVILSPRESYSWTSVSGVTTTVTYNFKLIPQTSGNEAFPDETQNAAGYSEDKYEVWVTINLTGYSGQEDEPIMVKFRGEAL